MPRFPQRTYKSATRCQKPAFYVEMLDPKSSGIWDGSESASRPEAIRAAKDLCIGMANASGDGYMRYGGASAIAIKGCGRKREVVFACSPPGFSIPKRKR